MKKSRQTVRQLWFDNMLSVTVRSRVKRQYICKNYKGITQSSPKTLWRQNGNGYLTIFLSLSLTIFLGVFLGLIGSAWQNLEKMRFEIAADIGMNSLLGEFHRELLEQYDLLFVDISYGTDNGQIENMVNHLENYIINNTQPLNKEIPAWMGPELKQVEILEYVRASDYGGMILRQQACAYMRESGKEDNFTDLQELAMTARELDKIDGMKLWSEVMETIAAMTMPFVRAENGQWEEVALENPADEVFGMANERLNSLYYGGGMNGTGIVITPASYISHRDIRSGPGSDPAIAESDRYLYLAYLFDKLGIFRSTKKNSLLEYQIEYVIFGEKSDRENIAAVAEKIFQWRFADYIRIYFSNNSQYAEAEEIAGALYAVRLKPELLEPVTHSILYAWAFMDSIYDTGSVIHGERVPLVKGLRNSAGEGLDYRQYLWLMLCLINKEQVSRRTMDIIEMDIRQTAYNQNFRMDWCLESYRVRIEAAGRLGAMYEIDRKYGYY